jgi:FMN phosphatase YigB (HAD superfamily)
MELSAVIFDFIGVLAEMDYARAAAFLEPLTGMPLRRLVERWEAWSLTHAHEFVPGSDAWQSFWTVMGDELALRGDDLTRIRDFQFGSLFKVYDDSVAALDAVRARGLRIAILSNSVLPQLASMPTMTALVPRVHLVCTPHNTMALKPDASAYRTALEGLGVAAQQCLMFDNEPRFAAAATALGIQAYIVDRTRRLPAGEIPIIQDLFGVGRLLDDPDRSGPALRGRSISAMNARTPVV